MEFLLIMYISNYNILGITTERFATREECSNVGNKISDFNTGVLSKNKFRCIKVQKLK